MIRLVLYCDEFTYNGKSSADFELVPCTFSTSDSENTYLTKELYSTSMTYNRPKRNISGAVYSEPLQFTISVMHNDSKRFTPIEIREIQSWLTSNNQPAEFTAFHREYTNHHFYGVVTSLNQIVAGGYVCGFTFTLETNAPYAWSDEYEQIESINKSGTFDIKIHSDEPEAFIYPTIIITPTSASDKASTFVITNTTDDAQTMTFALNNNYTYTIDTEYKRIMKTDSKGNTTTVSLNEVGWDANYIVDNNNVETNEMTLYWFRLIDGINEVSASADYAVDLTFKYRLPVKAGVQ